MYIYIYILENNIYCIKTFMSNGLSVIMVNVYPIPDFRSGQTYVFVSITGMVLSSCYGVMIL